MSSFENNSSRFGVIAGMDFTNTSSEEQSDEAIMSYKTNGEGFQTDIDLHSLTVQIKACNLHFRMFASFLLMSSGHSVTVPKRFFPGRFQVFG